MSKLPITGDTLYDFVLILIVIIIGFAISLKAGKNWGYIFVVGGMVWAYLLVKGKWGL